MTRVFTLSQLPTGHMHQVTVGEYDVLLANVKGAVYAVENKCSHYGAPLTKGAMCEHRVRCPWHHACFDLRTGEQLEAPGMDGLATFTVEVRGDDIYVSEQPTATNGPDRLPSVETASNGHYTYAVVGGGVAAAYAVEAIREHDAEGSILLVSGENLPPYDRTKVSKAYLQDAMPEQKLTLRSSDFYRRIGVDFRAGTRVQSVALDQKILTLGTGDTIQYDKVLLATGGTPRTLDVPGADLAGVFTIRKSGDAEAARQATTEGSRVVIIGGSFIGLEAAMSLGKRGGKITVVTPEEILFERVFGERVGKYVQHLHEAAGVTFRLGRKSTKFSGSNAVTGVILDNGDELPADLVVVGIGVQPVTDYVSGIAYQDDHSISVDSHLAAHAEGAYVAGDIATYPDREGLLRIEHWKVAAQQGRVAGRNMAGSRQNYTMLPFFWSNQQGTNLRYAGHATDFDEIVFDGAPGEGPFLAFYLRGGHVQACLGVQRDAETAAIAELMARGSLPASDQLRGQDWMKRCRAI